MAATTQSEIVHNAEQRAEKAEQQVAQLEQRLQSLEESQAQVQKAQTIPPAPSAGPSPSQKNAGDEDPLTLLRREPMMDHLLNALDSGQDIGHYGRLVFAMIGHHFLSEEAMIDWLTKDQTFTHDEAVALLRQVEGRDYNPPRRERILDWQSQQDFPILPNPDDPDCGNVYRNLKFPQSVYDHIQEYQEEKVQAQEEAGPELS